MSTQVQELAEGIDWLHAMPKVLTGNETVKIGSGERVRMPLSTVDANERDVVVTTSMHGGFLEVLPKWRYERYYARLFKKMSMSFEDGFRNYADSEFLESIRDLVSNHYRVTLDESLRLTLPKELMEEVGIRQGDEVVVAGNVEWAEIWPLALWEARKESRKEARKSKRTNREKSRVFSDAGSGAGATGGDAGAGSPSLDLN